MNIMKPRYVASGLLIFALLYAVWAQRSPYTSADYTKYEYRIPMRDGKKLFTAVYAPKDDSHTYPIMLNRTPYSVAPYGVDNYRSSLGPSTELANDGFIFAYQDVRGAMMSEGDFVNMRPYSSRKDGPHDVDESSDAYDTIEWLVNNIPNNNGNVGLWGISYPGFYAASGLIDAHPALKAVSPQAPIADWFIGDDFHHNGAFYLAHSFGFLSTFGRPREELTQKFPPRFNFPSQDGYDFYLKMGPLPEANNKYLKNEIPFWNEIMQHGNYDDFWKSRNPAPHLNNIKPAVMTVGGWFDAEDLYGTLSVYKSIEASSPDAFNILVMGPWYHGGWTRSKGRVLGKVDFGADTADFYRREIEFPFFRYFLKGEGDLSLPEAYVFQTGKNLWKQEDEWPPAKAEKKTLYLCSDWKLDWSPHAVHSGDAFDEYISDPGKPVPYTNEISMGMTREHMIDDQRFASRRSDVLTYATDVLKRDITIGGPVIVNLNVSTTGTDSDFVVKLIDVYPDNARLSGFQQLVRGEAFRGKFRNSYSEPEPFVPGRITRIKYQMPDILHTFRKGHRIMIQIQSSWFPLVDMNPQQFTDIYHAKASDFIKATQRIYRSSSSPSFITVNEIN